MIRTKALRRTANLWSAEEALLLNIGPWDTTGYTYSQAKIHPLPPVLPRIVDQDALDVAAYQGVSDEEAEEPQHGQAPEQEALPGVSLLDESEEAIPTMSAAGMDLDTTEAGESASAQPMSFPASHAGGASSGEPRSEPMKRHESLQLLESPKVPRTEEPPVPEPKVKAARTEVRMVYDVEAITTEEVGLEEMWDAYPIDFEEDKDDTELQKGEDEGPPQLSEEQVAILDSEAALEEIKKLYDLNVIEPCTLDPFSVLPEQLVDTPIVKDWRFREGNWRRRCRIVAREYRNSQTNEEQYSPTSSFAAVRLLLVMALIHNLSITSLDVKDAFLVEQRELMFVEVPAWIRGLIDKDHDHTHWRLLRCLPGQRNAAMRWNEHFTALCVESGFQPYPGCSTVMKMIQGDRRVYLSVHVDDIILVCKPEDVTWFSQTVGRTLTMKWISPLPKEKNYFDP